jgi:hypothetical protein
MQQRREQAIGEKREKKDSFGIHLMAKTLRKGGGGVPIITYAARMCRQCCANIYFI